MVCYLRRYSPERFRGDLQVSHTTRGQPPRPEQAEHLTGVVAAAVPREWRVSFAFEIRQAFEHAEHFRVGIRALQRP